MRQFFNKISDFLFLDYLNEITKIKYFSMKISYIISCFCLHVLIFLFVYSILFLPKFNFESLFLFVIFDIYLIAFYLKDEFITTK